MLSDIVNAVLNVGRWSDAIKIII